ncbi:MAG: hypothetical protein QS748_02350 [Candidatus Endonucleobacter bathymodioli]|uniref:Uncharacterized protein n=1 Tax=Candidatus Endonucleibacter bathymodioli TaxID=539814 RepID=A0AA90NPJ0_9GAMM|nr:hypothetical protein [Candidatus Endonucleobacter bathymodioli]
MRHGSEEEINNIPDIIMKVISTLFLDENLTEAIMYKAITSVVTVEMQGIKPCQIEWLCTREKDKIFTPRMKAIMKNLEAYARDFIFNSYYEGFYYYLDNDDFEYALHCLNDATAFAERHCISSKKSRILLNKFSLYSAAGHFDAALGQLNKSEDTGFPQAIWNSAIIDMGLCKEYRHKSNPDRAFKKLRSIHSKAQRWSEKNKLNGFSFKQKDIQATIITIWGYFNKRTMHAEDFPKARDSCFKMIASVAKTFEYINKDHLTILEIMAKKEKFDDPMLMQLVAKIYPASDCGHEHWEKLYNILHYYLVSTFDVTCYDEFAADMKGGLMEIGIPEDIVDSFFEGCADISGLVIILVYNYDFIVNYIEWTNTVNKMRKNDDKIHQDEMRKTLIIITDFILGDIDVTNNKSEWLANPPEWLTRVVSSQEWARQSLAARYDLYEKGVNQKNADFYAYMCKHASANECRRLNDLNVLPVITTGEEGSLSDANTASATIQNNTLSSEHSVIVNAIALIERSEKEDAIHLLQTFINNNNSAVVEHLLGYMKEAQSRALKGDEFRYKQDEVIKHYKNAGAQGIEYAEERADLFLRNRFVSRMAEMKREKQKQNDPMNYNNEIHSNCLSTSLSVMDLEKSFSSLADSHNELFEPLTSQACQLKPEAPLKLDTPPEFRDRKVTDKKYTSLSASIAQYHIAMESVDGYGSDIDFDREYSAIKSMRNAIKEDDATPVATRIQVEQYKAWYYYKMIKYSGRYKLNEDNKKDFKRSFNNALIRGFSLFSVDIMITDTVTSVRNIKKSGIRNILAEQDQNIRIQLASLASTWGHFYSDIHPHKNQHQELFELSSWLNPSKHKSHLVNIPAGKLTVVEDIEPLRLFNRLSHKTRDIYYK